MARPAPDWHPHRSRTMRRRDIIIALALGSAAWPLAASSQQPDRPKKVAVLMGTAATELGNGYLATFLSRLDELGWKAGRNLRTEVRWWSGGRDHMRSVIAELIAFEPDAFMVFSNLALEVLKPLAGNTPIVFVGVGDPVGDGFVTSLSRPGGNITGLSGTDGPIGSKWVEVLKETVPSMTRALAVLHLATPVHQAFWESIREAAPRVGVEVVLGGVNSASDIEAAIASFAAAGGGGLIIAPHAVTW